MPDGTSPVPLTMFQFTREELALNPEMGVKLIPPHRVDDVKNTPNPYLDVQQSTLSNSNATTTSSTTTSTLPVVAENA